MTRGETMPSAENKGSSRCWNAGSPIQPRPRLVSVTPSWVAERKASSRRCADATALARQSPARVSSAMRVVRTRTMANSAATKKAFRRTSPRATRTRTGSDGIREGETPGNARGTPPGREARCMTLEPDPCIFDVFPVRAAVGHRRRRSDMRRGVVAMAVVWAVVLGGARAGLARGDHEIDNDQLEVEMARNRALDDYVARNGKPDIAESRELADRPPWDDHEVTLYYFDAKKEIAFARAWILGRPSVHLERYERPLSDTEVAALSKRAHRKPGASERPARMEPRAGGDRSGAVKARA